MIVVTHKMLDLYPCGRDVISEQPLINKWIKRSNFIQMLFLNEYDDETNWFKKVNIQQARFLSVAYQLDIGSGKKALQNNFENCFRSCCSC